MSWLGRHATPLILFAVGMAVFSAVAGSRMMRQSTDPHFVYQADAWLHGQLAIDPPPAKGDDWCKVERVELTDGQTVRGRRRSDGSFQTTTGRRIARAEIARSLGHTYYVSFPPFPAVLMLPQAAIHGRDANDVFTTVVVAALVLPLFWFALRRLRDAGLSDRSDADHLWLTAAFAFGTVFFFSSVQGRVWFTAHVVGVALALGYVWASIEARRPVLAGVLLGLGAITRVPLAFLFPLFLFEAWRTAGDRANLRPFVRRCALFAAPVVAIAVLAMIHNAARFDAPLDFGHTYLDVMQQKQIEEVGMFSHRYLSRNLAVALALLPDVSSAEPYVKISGHGLAIWFTTPLVLLALWPRTRNALHRPVWITTAAVALPTLLYQNSGWVQFGYRFSLDYLPLVFVLIAIGGRPLRWTARGLIIAALLINLFGALTFAREWKYYRASRADYPAVIRH